MLDEIKQDHLKERAAKIFGTSSAPKLTYYVPVIIETELSNFLSMYKLASFYESLVTMMQRHKNSKFIKAELIVYDKYLFFKITDLKTGEILETRKAGRGLSAIDNFSFLGIRIECQYHQEKYYEGPTKLEKSERLILCTEGI